MADDNKTSDANVAKTAAENAAAESAARDRAAASANRAASNKAAAVESAASVADAIKRVADAAVAEVRKVEPTRVQDFVFAGSRNGRFTIKGKGFSVGGTVRINGVQAETNGWGDDHIDGRVPSNVPAGRVTVEVHGGQPTQRGEFTI